MRPVTCPSKVHLAHTQDNMGLVTKRPCAISVALNPLCLRSSSPRPIFFLIITDFQLNTCTLLFSVCTWLQGHTQSHHFFTDGPTTPTTTRYSIPAAYAHNYNTSSQSSMVAPHSTSVSLFSALIFFCSPKTTWPDRHEGWECN